MKKTLVQLLSSLEVKEGKTFDYIIEDINGKTLSADCQEVSSVQIESLVFDSRAVKENSMFFALPGTHTTGNQFVANAIQSGASVIVYQDEFSESERMAINDAVGKSGKKTVFVKVKSSRFAMSPLSAAFYDYPSKKLIIVGVTGTEGKSSTVSFVWELLRLSGFKAGFISTVQYSLGGDAVSNPEHQTTPEATIVQRELYEMVQNGCQYAVVESSSHGLSEKLNRLGDVLFDCGIFTNVTLEHLEFHGTFEQYRYDKANLFRALDKHDHIKTVCGKECKVHSFGVVNLEDPSASYFVSSTKKKVIGFTTEGKAGRQAEDVFDAVPLPKIPEDMPYLAGRNIASARFGLSFSIHRYENVDSIADGNRVIHVNASVPGAFNAYNIMAAMIAVHGLTEKPMEELALLCKNITPVKGRMTVVDQGQPFEVIVDYAHTPSSFETIFPPVRKRCTGRMICLFGSGGERDIKKRPLQGEIAAKFCDIVILTDEDPRGEDSMALLEDIAVGARKAGKADGSDLFMIPDRPSAIRKAFAFAKEGDIVLLLGKSHENSIIYKDHVMKYDEISEAKAALKEIGF